ncbi:hypothetical protein BC629DRAFT_1452013, partial [Irpex lacteus]
MYSTLRPAALCATYSGSVVNEQRNRQVAKNIPADTMDKYIAYTTTIACVVSTRRTHFQLSKLRKVED